MPAATATAPTATATPSLHTPTLTNPAAAFPVALAAAVPLVTATPVALPLLALLAAEATAEGDKAATEAELVALAARTSTVRASTAEVLGLAVLAQVADLGRLVTPTGLQIASVGGEKRG